MSTAAPDLSTRQLRAFLALADRSNFTRAAEACHLSQPAFSALIQALEQALGARLFDRSTRSVQLTPEGRLFEPSARRLLAGVAEALQDLGDQVERRRGRVHIAALPSLAAGWLPALFAEFRAAWPGVELALSDQLSDACVDLVRGGQADFALAAGGTRPADAAGLSMQPLCTDRFHLVCRADHPLAALARPTLRRIAAYPFVHMTRNSSVRQALEAALHPVAMNTVLEVEQLATVMGMVEAGVGISVVPTLTLYQFRRETLVTRPIPLPQLTRRIFLVRRREGSLSVAAQTLHDLVVARLGSIGRG
ncbi:LysR family transcriptional regulator [Xylophilus sp. Leaf220]|uniref:LysR family transcriptional regulator n=1 Tax=Xylophilus sp. Leaf220 TaxID=1735686 RepID=UPI0006F6E2E3|nr:LysR family transcriptional regulator [Xylophilus sp. Leaf220]KQM80241.1 LysR family transcriptional regulator [Xylophilus sp. Leaf220]